MFARILIAIDASEPAQYALEAGGALAAAFHGDVKLVHVISPPALDISPDVPTANQLRQEGDKLLAKLQRRLPPNVAVEFEVHDGRPAEQISAAARQWNADLVVVGHHNRHMLSRFVLGSVADAVVRHAPCPVLVVRQKDQELSAVAESAAEVIGPCAAEESPRAEQDMRTRSDV
jgi:universal stress protein A